MFTVFYTLGNNCRQVVFILIRVNNEEFGKTNFMADFNNLNIKGTAQQKQKLIEAAKAAKQFCKQGAADEIANVDYIFTKLPENLSGWVEKKGDKYIIKLPESFTERSSDDREGTLCHELSHVNSRKKRNNPYFLPSKESELKAFTDQYSSIQKKHAKESEVKKSDDKFISKDDVIMQELNKITKEFDKKTEDLNKKYDKKMLSKEEIMKDINIDPFYRCLPPKEPTSAAEMDMAERKYNACKNVMSIKDFITSIFKTKKSN